LPNETLGSLEEIHRSVSIGYHEALQLQALQEIGLLGRSSSGDSSNSIGTNGIDDSLELVGFDFGQILSLLNLEFIQGGLMGNVCLLLLYLHGQIGLDLNFLCFSRQLGLSDSGFSLDGHGLCLGVSLGGGLTGSLNNS